MRNSAPAPDGGAVRLQEAVWGGTSGGRAAATVQGFPGVTRQAGTLVETGHCGCLFGKFQTFFFFLKKRRWERNVEILRRKLNLLLGPIYVF